MMGGLLCVWRTWACTVFRWGGCGIPGGLAGVSGCGVMGEMVGVSAWVVVVMMGVL